MFVCKKANFNQSQNSSEISTGGLFCDFLKPVVEGWNFHCTGYLANCHTKVQKYTSQKFLPLVSYLDFWSLVLWIPYIDPLISLHLEKLIHCWNPIAKKKDFLYPLQHCVAHASLNFYTYIVYSTLKHVRNLLSIFFFILEESRTLSLAFPILSCHTDMNITHFFLSPKY